MRSRLGPIASLGIVAVLAAFSGFGCARAETAADRHVAEMTDAIQGIQTDQDKSPKGGRLDVGDDKGILPKLPASSSKPQQASQASAKAGPAGAPRVVQLGGDDSFENDDPNDPTQRPEIRLVGTPGTRRGREPREPRESRESREPRAGSDAAGSDAAASGRPSALDPDARRAYDDALALVNAKQHDRALEALNAFLVRWPDHPYAENAMYWRGEVSFAKGDYLRAAEQFEAVVGRFGAGRKAPDALLKMGMCHERLGSPARAQEYWARLRRDFPESAATRKIPKETR